jgi:hypothetical protein
MIIIPITLLESNDTPSVDFGSIQITEVDYNGYVSFDQNSTSATKEAIEITNTSSQMINLSDWQLRIVSGNTDKSIILEDISLAPSEVFVFVRGLNIPEHIKGINYTGSLDNSLGAFIEMRDSRGVTIDSFNQFGHWNPELMDDRNSLQKISFEWKSCPATLGNLNTCSAPDHSERQNENILPEEDASHSEQTPPQDTPQDFTIRINEILPNPIGSDTDFEFVELYNYGNTEVSLDELLLDDILDGGSSPQNLTGTIPAQSYYLLQGDNLQISLNNTGDEVNLIHEPTQTIIDSFIYTKDHVEEGKSIEKVDEKIRILGTPTPGEENLQNHETTENTESLQKYKNTSSKKSEENITPFTLSKGIILINEILPNPDGKDTEKEFIELLNTSPDKISLKNWQLKIDTKSFTLDNHSIEGEELLTLLRPESKLTLSNSKTFTLELIAPNGQIYDSITIVNQEDHHAFAKHEDAWAWTATPTPGEKNIISTLDQTSTTNQDKEIPSIPLEEVFNQEHNTKISTEGIVIRESNLNAKYVYLSDGENIIKVYSTKKELASLKKGNYIKVSGTWFANENNTYLRIKDFTEDITVIAQSKPPIHAITSTSDISLVPLLQNVEVTGIVDNQSGKSWNLITPDSIIKVELAKDLDLKKPEFTKGDSMTVIGFVDIERGVRRVIISNVSQISITPQESVDKATDQPNDGQNSEELSEVNQQTSLSSLIQATIQESIPQVFRFLKPHLSNPYILGFITITGIGISGFILKDFIKKPK